MMRDGKEILVENVSDDTVLQNGMRPERKPKKVMSRETKRIIFYISVVAIPIIQFCIFYIGVNFNSILLAFKDFDVYTGKYSWVGFENFQDVFHELASVDYFKTALKNSLINYAFSLLIGFSLGLLFSYYIYKNMMLHDLFKVILFLPSVISSLVMVLMFKYFVENAIPYVVQQITHQEIVFGLLGNPKTTFGTILFYCIWSSFGGAVLMYTGSMSGINPSVVEAAQIDGITPIKEFIFITLPSIYPTLTVFTVVGVAGIFTNQMNLYSFYGPDAEYKLYTFGYYLYKRISGESLTLDSHPFLSAFGLVMTLVAVPLTMIVKFCLEKFGPSVD